MQCNCEKLLSRKFFNSTGISRRGLIINSTINGNECLVERYSLIINIPDVRVRCDDVVVSFFSHMYI